MRKIWIKSTHLQLSLFTASKFDKSLQKKGTEKVSQPWGCWVKQKSSSNVFETETVLSCIIKDQWRTKPQAKAAFFHSSVLSDKRKSIVAVRFTSERSAYLGMSTAPSHPEDVCAVPRSSSAWSEGKKSPPQSTQQWHKPLISDKFKTWWKQGKGMQIVLLFTIVEELFLNSFLCSKTQRRFPFFLAFFVLQNSFFCFRGFSSSQHNVDIFLRSNVSVGIFIYTKQ